MEWRTRQSRHGGWLAEKGIKVEAQPNPFGPGYLMPAFIVYEMHPFATQKQAEKFVSKMEK